MLEARVMYAEKLGVVYDVNNPQLSLGESFLASISGMFFSCNSYLKW
jgi:hypothetical protein